MNRGDLLDQPGVDNYLAHSLLRSGALDRGSLERLLADVRAGTGLTLARTILQRNVLERSALEDALADLLTHEALSAAPIAPAVQEHRIGDYKILERLGTGGMGVVHAAEHVATGVRYAIKTLSGVLEPQAILRFQREALGHAKVDSHPNVVRVHSFGQYPGGLYLVVELVSGGSLGDRLRGKPLSSTESAQLVRDLARGLAHIHTHGVLHRDLKPDNVLLDGEVPRLADFGLAKVVGEHSLTVSGAALGTPAYMAPEQVDPSTGELGPWTDVYGLGAVLYHCLTGRAPFVGASALAIMVQSMRTKPTAMRELRPEIPARLEAICLRCLVKNPEERIRSAEELGNELDRFLADADEAPRGLHARRLVAVAGALAAGVVVSVWATGLGRSPLRTEGQATAKLAAPEGRDPLGPAAAEERPAVPDAETSAESSVLFPHLPIQRKRLLPEVERRIKSARALTRQADLRVARDALTRLLWDPITGKVRPSVAGTLGELLNTGGRGIERDATRASALLFEAALHGDGTSLQALSLAFLSSELLERVRKRNDFLGLRVFAFDSDDDLSAACVEIQLSRTPRHSFSLAIREALETRDVPWPSVEEAYRTLWTAYAQKHPRRASDLVSEVPLYDLPLRSESWATQEAYDRVGGIGAAREPKAAIHALKQFLLDEDGELRVTVARDLGRLLCSSTGKDQDPVLGFDLLTEAALRGEAESARFLCLALVAVANREALAKTYAGVGPSADTEFALRPNPRVAAACAMLHASDDDDNEFGNRMLEFLSGESVERPKSLAAAYLTLWEHYDLRRSVPVLTDDPSSD